MLFICVLVFVCDLLVPLSESDWLLFARAIVSLLSRQEQDVHRAVIKF